MVIDKTLGCCRFLYNQMLAERIEVFNKLKNDRSALYTYKYKTEKDYKEEFEFLKEADAFALQQSRIGLEKAYANFYRTLKTADKSKAFGFPNFKSASKHKDTYRTGMAVHVDFQQMAIKIPKVSNSITFRHNGPIKDWYLTSSIKSISIKRSPTNKYYASCLFEGEQDYTGNQDVFDKVIGLDMSLHNFFVDSLGNSPEYERHYRANEKRIAILMKRFAAKADGSKNREKARIRLASIHEKIKNKRSDFIEKLSKKLIAENDVVVVENLGIRDMTTKMNLGKSVMDLGYSSFVGRLQYKSVWNDKTVIMADKWFSSSKTCHVCGFVNKGLLLQQRSWDCPKCSTSHNRDVNAAMNLKKYGIKILSERQESMPIASATKRDDVGSGSSDIAGNDKNH